LLIIFSTIIGSIGNLPITQVKWMDCRWCLLLSI